MFHKVYLALGSNLGNKEKNLKEAVSAIGLIDRSYIKRLSKVYETEPVGYINQDNFLNMVLYMETELDPNELLGKLQGIETELKRIRQTRWGPRTIDLDILLYDNLSMQTEELVIPHPRMAVRAFVLVPLNDIYQYDPLIELDINKLIENCADKEGVKFYKSFEDLQNV